MSHLHPNRPLPPHLRTHPLSLRHLRPSVPPLSAPVDDLPLLRPRTTLAATAPPPAEQERGEAPSAGPFLHTRPRTLVATATARLRCGNSSTTAPGAPPPPLPPRAPRTRPLRLLRDPAATPLPPEIGARTRRRHVWGMCHDRC
jgi:hypothetical protein